MAVIYYPKLGPWLIHSTAKIYDEIIFRDFLLFARKFQVISSSLIKEKRLVGITAFDSKCIFNFKTALLILQSGPASLLRLLQDLTGLAQNKALLWPPDISFSHV